MKICPNCGSEVLENAEYCTRCGWHFEKSTQLDATADSLDNQQGSVVNNADNQSEARNEKSHLITDHVGQTGSELDEKKQLDSVSEGEMQPKSTVDEQVKAATKAADHPQKKSVDSDQAAVATETESSDDMAPSNAAAPDQDEKVTDQVAWDQNHLLSDEPQANNAISAEPDQKTAISAAGEAKAIEKPDEHEPIKSRTQARKAAASKTKSVDAGTLDVTLDLEHAKQGFNRAWDWLIESLRHPGEYRRPSWRWTGLVMLILEALFSVITISWMVDHLSEKIAQLASGSAIVFHIKAMTAGSFCLLWLLIVVAALLMSAVAYVFKRYVNGIEGGDWVDMINHLTWASNFNVILILISLLLAVMTSSLGMMTLVGIVLLIALGLFALALADEMLNAGPQKLDRIYGALIVLIVNGLIVFAAISLGGKLIKEIIVAMMLQLF